MPGVPNCGPAAMHSPTLASDRPNPNTNAKITVRANDIAMISTPPVHDAEFDPDIMSLRPCQGNSGLPDQVAIRRHLRHRPEGLLGGTLHRSPRTRTRADRHGPVAARPA